MNEWKWRPSYMNHNDIVEKSMKEDKSIIIEKNTNNLTKRIINQHSYDERFTRHKDYTKRFMNEQDMDRAKLVQTNINPYLRNNNYLSDLDNEDRFLRPKSSNLIEKGKHQNNSESSSHI